MKKKIKNQKVEGSPPEVRRFFWILVGVSGVLVLWALSLSLDRTGDIRQFMAKGWPQDAARVIVQNKITALWHASFMAAVVTAVFALFSFPTLGKKAEKVSKHWKTVVAVALVLIVAADAVKLSKYYVKEMPRSYIEANALTDFLQENVGHQRVALLTQEGIYNIWVAYLLPYNRIPTFNFAQMSRMQSDYKNLLATGSKNPFRMWRFAGVKYLLGPSAFQKQLPVGVAKKVFAYDLAPAANGSFQVIASPAGAHAVFELLETVPRYCLVEPEQIASDEQAALNRIGDVRKPLLGAETLGSVAVLQYRPGRVELKVRSDRPAVLRAAEKYDADWIATIDGDRADVRKIDYLCQGVSLPAGEHTVVLKYAPSKHFFYMQCAGYLILAGALLWTFFQRKKGSDA